MSRSRSRAAGPTPERCSNCGEAIAPLVAGDYLLTVLILILYFCYTGQAWNIMMGFAGQLSLGHALYVGLGAYTAAALYVHFGVAAWLGLLVAVETIPDLFRTLGNVAMDVSATRVVSLRTGGESELEDETDRLLRE